MAIRILIILLAVYNIECKLSDCKTYSDICPNPDIDFWLFTMENPENPHKPTFILIHGFTGYANSTPNNQLKPELLKNDSNVIVVDFAKFVPGPCYLGAIANSRIVARCIAKLIDGLVKENRISHKELHVIGFSLGAHISGYISEFIKTGKLEHITGLDPAGAFFSTNLIGRNLNKNDANFVDIIHTSFYKGKTVAMGHVDFYVNGMLSQPGCPEIIVCNHIRAAEYYAESIHSVLGFWGGNCYDYHFCKNETIEIMGFKTPKTARGTFYVKTKDHYPFAAGKIKPIQKSYTKYVADIFYRTVELLSTDN